MDNKLVEIMATAIHGASKQCIENLDVCLEGGTDCTRGALAAYDAMVKAGREAWERMEEEGFVSGA